MGSRLGYGMGIVVWIWDGGSGRGRVSGWVDDGLRNW